MGYRMVWLIQPQDPCSVRLKCLLHRRAATALHFAMLLWTRFPLGAYAQNMNDQPLRSASLS